MRLSANCFTVLGAASNMPIQKVPLETLQKVRQYIQTALALPESENSPRSLSLEADLPNPNLLGDLGSLFNFGGSDEFESHAPNDRGEWFVSATNPGAALTKLPGVRLKPGLRLVAYLNRTAKDGAGVTWAVPEALSTTAQLEQALMNGNQPIPEAALPNVMDAIEGDRSPLSFAIASLIQRELQELGAVGKSCNWSHHRLINALPTQVKWNWRVKPPQDLSPKVLIYPDQKAAIEFFTCRVLAPVAIFQHVDQYPAAHYKPVSVDRAIAIPQRA